MSLGQIEAGCRGWKFFRDNAKDWIRLCGPDVYLHEPYGGPFDIDMFPWHLDVLFGGPSGGVNHMPSGIKFSATDTETGINYRWSVETYIQMKDTREFWLDSGRLADLISKLDTPERRAMFVKAMQPSVAALSEEIARADKWRARLVSDRAILRDALESAK